MELSLYRYRGRLALGFSLLLAPLVLISTQMVSDERPENPYSNKILSAICCEEANFFTSEMKAEDPCVIKRIRKNFLRPPSNQAYNLSDVKTPDPSMGQSKVVLQTLDQKMNGFFVECGALDGETRSNTLFMERNLGWTGLLVEGDPSNFKKLAQKRRKAWAAPVCLSLKPHPTVVSFFQQFSLGHVTSVKHKGKNFVDVECYPLYSLLLAVEQTDIDYFSLDVEGSELKILKTIPWDKVNIRTLSVEYIHDKEGKNAVRSYMESVGYELVAEVVNNLGLANDFIFKKIEERKQSLKI